MKRSKRSPFFARLAEQTLREIETLLGLSQFVLEVLDTTLECLESGRDVGRRCRRTSGTDTSDLDDGKRGDPHEYQECGEKHSRFHDPFFLGPEGA